MDTEMESDESTLELEGVEIKTVGHRAPADIPNGIVKKLARMAGLPYRDGAPEEGGGLCRGIEGVKQRKRALAILGALVSKVGKGSTDAAIESVGSTWLDVMIWREDPEYAALWGGAERLRDTAMGARVKDTAWDCSLNGRIVEEVKNGVRVKVRKFDNMLPVQMLKGVGLLGRGGPVRVPKKGEKEVKPEPGMDGAPAEQEAVGENVDTVLFADRATAFRMMKTDPQAAEGKGG